MDLMSALKNEIFRPLTTLVVPGFFAAWPFIMLCQRHFKAVNDFSRDNFGGYAAVLFVVILAAGLILEDIGGRLENRVSKSLEATDPKHATIWRDYLKLNTQDQFIGQRYLRTIVTRFYFELTMTPALVFFLIGFHWLNCMYPFISCSGALIITIAVILVGTFLMIEAKRSAYVLSTLRQAIVEGYREDKANNNNP